MQDLGQQQSQVHLQEAEAWQLFAQASASATNTATTTTTTGGLTRHIQLSPVALRGVPGVSVPTSSLRCSSASTPPLSRASILWLAILFSPLLAQA